MSESGSGNKPLAKILAGIHYEMDQRVGAINEEQRKSNLPVEGVVKSVPLVAVSHLARTSMRYEKEHRGFDKDDIVNRGLAVLNITNMLKLAGISVRLHDDTEKAMDIDFWHKDEDSNPINDFLEANSLSKISFFYTGYLAEHRKLARVLKTETLDESSDISLIRDQSGRLIAKTDIQLDAVGLAAHQMINQRRQLSLASTVDASVVSFNLFASAQQDGGLEVRYHDNQGNVETMPKLYRALPAML